MNTHTLPFLPSALLTVAIRDFKAILKQPRRFEIDMDSWVMPRGNVCAVCFGGAVMVKSLKVATDLARIPQSCGFPPETINRIEALDSFRVGDFPGALEEIGIQWDSLPNGLKDELIALENNWEEFDDTAPQFFITQCEDARDAFKSYGY